MHSSPVLLTNQGKITYNDTTNAVDQRIVKILFYLEPHKDYYMLWMLSQVKKICFRSHELVESQAEAFNKPELTSGGMNSMYYKLMNGSLYRICNR